MKKIELCYHCLTTYFYYLEIVQPCNQKNNVVMGPQEKKWPVQLNKCAAVCFYYTMENKTGHIFSLTVCLQSSWASLWRIKEQNGVQNCHRKSWGCCLPVSKHAPICEHGAWLQPEETSWLKMHSWVEGKINTPTTMSNKMEKERGQIMAHDWSH